MYDLDMTNLGKRLKEYRKVNNISVEDLGKTIGKSRATINRYENR